MSIYLCMVDYISRDLFYKSARFSDIFFLEKETKKRPKRRGSIFQVSKPYFIHIIYLHYHVFYPKTDQWSQVPKTVIFQVYISSLFLKWFFHTSILIWLVWHIKTVLSQLWLVGLYIWVITLFENHQKCPIFNFSNFGIFHKIDISLFNKKYSTRWTNIKK